MSNKIIETLKSKKWVILIATLIIIVLIIILYSSIGRRRYDIFLEGNMPKDSYGYIKYSPGNQNEFNLYKDSYLNLEYTFSDNKKRDVTYIIEDENIVNIENNKLIAKNYGTTKVYIKTKNNINSNDIIVNVVEKNE